MRGRGPTRGKPLAAATMLIAFLLAVCLVVFVVQREKAVLYVEDFDDRAGMEGLAGRWYYTAGLTGYGYAVYTENGWRQLSHSTEIPETTCDDVSVIFKIIDSRAWQYAGIITRYDPQTGSGVLGYFSQMRGSAEVALVTLQNFGEGVRLGWASVSPINTEVWHELRITAEGDLYRLYLDGKEVLSGTVSGFVSGRVALWSYRGYPTLFDDLKVRIPVVEVVTIKQLPALEDFHLTGNT